jgi:hypothetical protein
MIHEVNHSPVEHIPMIDDVVHQLHVIVRYFEKDRTMKMPQDIYFCHAELRQDQMYDSLTNDILACNHEQPTNELDVLV